MRKKTSYNKGFTILETIVAVLILGISISAMVVIMGGGAQKTIHNKDRLTAAYLAQEGVELVRNIRDTVFLVHEDDVGITARWDIFKDDLDTCFTSTCAVSYNFDADSGEIPVIVSGGYTSPLKFNATTGRYSYGSGVATMFTRSEIGRASCRERVSSPV